MKTGAVALVFSAVALGAAVFGLTRESPAPQRVPMEMRRVADLEKQVAELTDEVNLLKAEKRNRITPAKAGPKSDKLRPERDDVANPSDRPIGDEDLEAIVDDAVDRKTKRVLEELRIKANKKPQFDAFVSVLDLTNEQRASAERVVADGQRQVSEILDTPTANGTNLMDGLVEIVARGIAQPGKDQGWGPWFARVASEKIPGTNQTYSARIEAVRNGINATFKREWSKEQFREFQEWGVNPTEIENVPGSPYAELGKRIMERARELGADIDDDK